MVARLTGCDVAARVTPDTPITYLKGVGPARAEAFRRLGIFTARDLLLPRAAPL
jgi:nucleotidyltransferase/DNA polymerase involved in DNA repair